MFPKPSGIVDVLIVPNLLADAELALHAIYESGVTNKVHVAINGKDALDFLLRKSGYAELAGKPHPKLILVDTPSEKAGSETLRSIRSHANMQSIPIVVLSPDPEDSGLAACYGSGANSCAERPQDSCEYAELVQSIARYWLHVNHA